MNEPEKTDVEQFRSELNGRNGSQDRLTGEIARALSTQATRVHFSPAMHAQVMQHLTPRRPESMRRRVSPALALAAALLLVLLIGLSAYLARVLPFSPQTSVPSVVFTNQGGLSTPDELAQDGQLVSLDPTGQRIVYSIASQPGVMYVTALANPVAQNQLAMRFAREASWSPDGSALVTTVYVSGESLPQLALVPTGQYMHLLGISAQSASWLPSSATTITFLTQQNGLTTLWKVTPDGRTLHTMATFALPAIAQHLSWSSNSRFLAILATPGQTPTRDLLQGASHALYLFDTLDHRFTELVAPASSTVGNLAWTPDGHLLTYEQRNAQGQSVLHTLDLSTRQTLFTLPLQHSLLGMSWSPDSRTLVYSDDGTLHARSLNGIQVTFPHLAGTATSPFWLDGQHILYLSIQHNRGQLARLEAQT